ncbi:hypothetical protein HMPREF1039_0914 [Megasphaera lornae]|uniref:Uncharacterized protein n=1 Tax=Megasphaera lornae TaxID=1000568 RepID=D3LSW2_9FIRM|nr:hypothetical protein HMPREF0889_1485 [Megasphaera genomosp. type_1 str. 28L]EGL39408.1 hypothetical protein HMPREF1039_0914 [Megasphaera lornae]
MDSENKKKGSGIRSFFLFSGKRKFLEIYVFSLLFVLS